MRDAPIPDTLLLNVIDQQQGIDTVVFIQHLGFILIDNQDLYSKTVDYWV